MALRVTDGLLVRTFVRQLPPDFAHAPLLVALFLQPFYPVVCHAHRHPEIEAQTARGKLSSKSRHSAHVLRDGYRIRIQFLCQHRGQCKIGYGIFVHPRIEIIVITDEIATQTVVPVQHTGHAVEPEAVQMIFLHPEFAVRQKEVFGF